MSQKILIIEPNTAIRAMYKETLEGRGLETRAFATLEESDSSHSSSNIDAVLLHTDASRPDGLSHIKRFGLSMPDAQIVVVCQTPAPEIVAEAFRAGAADVLIQPHDPQDLLNLVFRVLERGAETTQQVHDEQLAVASRMASGIAHHFNNLLEGVVGRTSLLLARSDLPHDIFREVKSVQEQGRQLADLVRRLSYVGESTLMPLSTIRPLRVLQDVVQRYTEMHPCRIRMQRDFDEAVIMHGNTQWLAELIREILSNAHEAGSKEQLIQISTRLTMHDGQARIHVDIEDEGPGITPHTEARIFHPFFSTKDSQERGLGLAVASSITKRLGGTLELINHDPKGVCATLSFPVDIAGEATTPPLTEISPPSEHSGTVLVIDDMEPVLAMVSRMVGMLTGDPVVSISDGKEGIEAVKQMADRITMVVLDLGLKEISGIVVYHEIRKLKPDLPVLFISGFTSDARLEQVLAEDKRVGFLQKPFELGQLRKAMRWFAQNEPEKLTLK